MFLLPIENTIWILYVWRFVHGREECVCAGVWNDERLCRQADVLLRTNMTTRDTRVVGFDDLPAGFVPTDQIIALNKNGLRS